MTVTMTMTVTKKQGTMPLLKVDCPRKASRPLESESWSAQAKLQGRRKQSKYCWPKNKTKLLLQFKNIFFLTSNSTL